MDDQIIECICNKKYDISNFKKHYKKCEYFLEKFTKFDYNMNVLLNEYLIYKDDKIDKIDKKILFLIKFLLKRYIKLLDTKIRHLNDKCDNSKQETIGSNKSFYRVESINNSCISQDDRNKKKNILEIEDLKLNNKIYTPNSDLYLNKFKFSEQNIYDGNNNLKNEKNIINNNDNKKDDLNEDSNNIYNNELSNFEDIKEKFKSYIEFNDNKLNNNTYNKNNSEKYNVKNNNKTEKSEIDSPKKKGKRKKDKKRNKSTLKGNKRSKDIKLKNLDDEDDF